MKLTEGQGNFQTFKKSYLGCFLIGEFQIKTSRFLIISAIKWKKFHRYWTHSLLARGLKPAAPPRNDWLVNLKLWFTFKNSYLGCLSIGEFQLKISRLLIISAINQFKFRCFAVVTFRCANFNLQSLWTWSYIRRIGPKFEWNYLPSPWLRNHRQLELFGPKWRPLICAEVNWN